MEHLSKLAVNQYKPTFKEHQKSYIFMLIEIPSMHVSVDVFNVDSFYLVTVQFKLSFNIPINKNTVTRYQWSESVCMFVLVTCIVLRWQSRTLVVGATSRAVVPVASPIVSGRCSSHRLVGECLTVCVVYRDRTSRSTSGTRATRRTAGRGTRGECRASPPTHPTAPLVSTSPIYENPTR